MQSVQLVGLQKKDWARLGILIMSSFVEGLGQTGNSGASEKVQTGGGYESRYKFSKTKKWYTKSHTDAL